MREYTGKVMIVAPFIPVPLTVSANVRFLWSGQKVENVLNFFIGELDFASACATIESALDATWWTAQRPFITNQCSHTETYYQDLTSPVGPTATFGPFSSPAGSNPLVGVPNNSTFCISHRTAHRGRTNRGRSYVIGLANDDIVGSYIGVGVAAALVGAYNDMRNELDGEDIQFSVVSRYFAKEPRVMGIATPIIISLNTDLILDSQRRRLPGRGT